MQVKLIDQIRHVMMSAVPGRFHPRLSLMNPGLKENGIEVNEEIPEYWPALYLVGPQ